MSNVHNGGKFHISHSFGPHLQFMPQTQAVSHLHIHVADGKYIYMLNRAFQHQWSPCFNSMLNGCIYSVVSSAKMMYQYGTFPVCGLTTSVALLKNHVTVMLYPRFMGLSIPIPQGSLPFCVQLYTHFLPYPGIGKFEKESLVKIVIPLVLT